jgi:hypothetical protein
MYAEHIIIMYIIRLNLGTCTGCMRLAPDIHNMCVSICARYYYDYIPFDIDKPEFVNAHDVMYSRYYVYTQNRPGFK